jgi:hypothetical protein
MPTETHVEALAATLRAGTLSPHDARRVSGAGGGCGEHRKRGGVMHGSEMGMHHRSSMAFAEAGPWRFDGLREPPDGGIVRVTGADGITVETRHGGTCAICGQAIQFIVDVSHVRTGQRATLGADCAETLARNLGKVKTASAIEKKMRAIRNAKARDASALRVARRRGELAALLLVDSGLTRSLRSRPHPHKHWADKGKSRLDYFAFCVARSGERELRSIAKELESASC